MRISRFNFRWIWAVPLLVVAVSGCREAESETAISISQTPAQIELPLGLPEFKIPADNPMTVEKIAIGKKLFFDKRLSFDDSMSCATCHDPDKAWGNGQPLVQGVNGETSRRHVPPIWNVAYNREQFWDGRARTLENQALIPVTSPNEMGMESEQALVDKLRLIDEYNRLFAGAFPDGLNALNIARSIACFERTIFYGDTAYDHFMAGNKQAMSESAIRGMRLFRNKRKTNCTGCHIEPLFMDKLFNNIGVGMDQEDPDLGYFESTGFTGSVGAFKTPSLRGVAESAPYMHDGSMATLEEVVEYYVKGGIPNRKLAQGVFRLRLTDQEKQDLVQFMKEGLSKYQPEEPDLQ